MKTERNNETIEEPKTIGNLETLKKKDGLTNPPVSEDEAKKRINTGMKMLYRSPKSTML